MNLKIKNFIRIDASIISMIKDNGGRIERYLGDNTKPHWAIVSFYRDNINKEILDFVKANEGCHTYLYNARSWLNPMWMEGKEGDDIFIGISMSTLTEELSDSLIGVRGIVPISEDFAVEKVAENLYAVAVDLFGVVRKSSLPIDLSSHNVAAPTVQISDNESIFKSWLEKLDLFYEYSDSMSVFKAGQKRLNDTIEKGINELGLTKAQCDKFVSEVYKSQLG